MSFNKKLVILAVLVFLPTIQNLAQTEKIDVKRVKKLYEDIDTLVKKLETYTEIMETLNNVDSINVLARNINEQTTTVIDSINKVFKVRQNDGWIDESTAFAVLVGITNADPNAIALYYTLSGINDMLSYTPPPRYYILLKDIADISYLLSRKNKINRLKKLITELKETSGELRKVWTK